MPRTNPLDEVVDRAPGFNSVNAWITPDGELVISLSHSNTDDEQVLVRVQSEADVILVDKVRRRNIDAWEDDTEQLGRLNHGGSW